MGSETQPKITSQREETLSDVSVGRDTLAPDAAQKTPTTTTEQAQETKEELRLANVGEEAAMIRTSAGVEQVYSLRGDNLRKTEFERSKSILSRIAERVGFDSKTDAEQKSATSQTATGLTQGTSEKGLWEGVKRWQRRAAELLTVSNITEKVAGFGRFLASEEVREVTSEIASFVKKTALDYAKSIRENPTRLLGDAGSLLKSVADGMGLTRMYHGIRNLDVVDVAKGAGRFLAEVTGAADLGRACVNLYDGTKALLKGDYTTASVAFLSAGGNLLMGGAKFGMGVLTVATGGTAGVLGYAAVLGVRSLVTAGAKHAAKAMAKKGFEALTKNGGSEILEKIGKEIFQETVEKASKQGVEVGTKEFAQEVQEQGAKAFTREGYQQSVKEATSESVEAALKKIGLDDAVRTYVRETLGKSTNDLAIDLMEMGAAKNRKVAQKMAQAMQREILDPKGFKHVEDQLTDSLCKQMREELLEATEKGARKELQDIWKNPASAQYKQLDELAKKSGKNIDKIADDYIEAGVRGAKEGAEEALERVVRQGVRLGLRDVHGRLRPRLQTGGTPSSASSNLSSFSKHELENLVDENGNVKPFPAEKKLAEVAQTGGRPFAHETQVGGQRVVITGYRFEEKEVITGVRVLEAQSTEAIQDALQKESLSPHEATRVDQFLQKLDQTSESKAA